MSDVKKNIGTHKPEFAGEWVKLGDVCEITMGQSPDSSSYNADCEGLPFYQGNADFGETHPMPVIWCSEPKKVAEPGDILISVRAPVGAINVADERCCIGRGLAAVRPSGSDISNAFLALILQSKRAYLDSMSTGSTFKAIGKKVLSSCEVPLYSHEVQSRIASKINGIDDCLRSSRKLLSTLDGLVKSQFVEMFGDPIEVIDGIALGSIALLKAGETTTSSSISNEMHDGLYPCYGGNGLRGFTAEYTHDGSYPLIGRQGALCGNVRMAVGKFKATEHAVVVQPSIEINRVWLFHYLRYDNLARLATGAAQPGLSVKNLNKVPVALPPLDLQRRFADFVAKVDKLGFGCCRMTTYCDALFSSVSARLLRT